MAEIYRMPAISPTMEVGTIVEWRVAEGDTLESGTVLADVGTDKANMEAEVFDDGVLLKLLVAENDEVPVDFPIAIIGEDRGEDISALLAEAEAEMARLRNGGGAPVAAPADNRAPAPEAAPAAPAPQPAAAPAQAASAVRTWMGTTLTTDFMDTTGDLRLISGTTRIAASPLAKKIADDRGVDLRRVQGSGPGGRIVRADVESAPAGGGTMTLGEARADEIVRNSPMRKTIAKRLLASHQDIPTFFLTIDLDMGAFVETRKMLKAQLPDARISFNDMLVAAVARALKEYPKANASWADNAITRHGRVDIGIAVALEDGLITPVLRNADQMTLSQIGSTTRELAGRAREGKLGPDEYTGGTFTISNLGMMGIQEFTAIINPPESAILAVGGINEVPIVSNGQVTTGHRMKVTMTCDHRVLDGAVGAGFLQVLRRYVETPALLLV